MKKRARVNLISFIVAVSVLMFLVLSSGVASAECVNDRLSTTDADKYCDEGNCQNICEALCADHGYANAAEDGCAGQCPTSLWANCYCGNLDTCSTCDASQTKADSCSSYDEEECQQHWVCDSNGCVGCQYSLYDNTCKSSKEALFTKDYCPKCIGNLDISLLSIAGGKGNVETKKIQFDTEFTVNISYDKYCNNANDYFLFGMQKDTFIAYSPFEKDYFNRKSMYYGPQMECEEATISDPCHIENFITFKTPDYLGKFKLRVIGASGEQTLSGGDSGWTSSFNSGYWWGHKPNDLALRWRGADVDKSVHEPGISDTLDFYSAADLILSSKSVVQNGYDASGGRPLFGEKYSAAFIGVKVKDDKWPCADPNCKTKLSAMFVQGNGKVTIGSSSQEASSLAILVNSELLEELKNKKLEDLTPEILKRNFATMSIQNSGVLVKEDSSAYTPKLELIRSILEEKVVIPFDKPIEGGEAIVEYALSFAEGLGVLAYSDWESANNIIEEAPIFSKYIIPPETFRYAVVNVPLNPGWYTQTIGGYWPRHVQMRDRQADVGTFNRRFNAGFESYAKKIDELIKATFPIPDTSIQTPIFDYSLFGDPKSYDSISFEDYMRDSNRPPTGDIIWEYICSKKADGKKKEEYTKLLVNQISKDFFGPGKENHFVVLFVPSGGVEIPTEYELKYPPLDGRKPYIPRSCTLMAGGGKRILIVENNIDLVRETNTVNSLQFLIAAAYYYSGTQGSTLFFRRIDAYKNPFYNSYELKSKRILSQKSNSPSLYAWGGQDESQDYILDHRVWRIPKNMMTLDYKQLARRIYGPPCIDPAVLYVNGVLYANDSIDLWPSSSYPNGTIALNSTGNYTAELLNTAQQVLTNMSFEPEWVYDEDNVSMNYSFFLLTLEYPEDAVSFRIKNNESVILIEVNKSVNAPVINDIHVQEIDEELLNITWNVSDIDNEEVYVSLNYNCTLWKNEGTISIASDLNSSYTNLTINKSGMAGGDECIIEIEATDGMNTIFDLSNTFSMINQNFTVSIFSPANNSVFSNQSDYNYTSENISFSGGANDIELGELDDENYSFEWTSDIDGFLSSKASFGTNALSSGMHTITLEVSDGATELSDSILINITDRIRPDLSLTGILAVPGKPIFGDEFEIYFAGLNKVTDIPYADILMYEGDPDDDGVLIANLTENESISAGIYSPLVLSTFWNTTEGLHNVFIRFENIKGMLCEETLEGDSNYPECSDYMCDWADIDWDGAVNATDQSLFNDYYDYFNCENWTYNYTSNVSWCEVYNTSAAVCDFNNSLCYGTDINQDGTLDLSDNSTLQTQMDRTDCTWPRLNEEDSTNNELNLTFRVYGALNDTNKMYIQDEYENTVAWLGNEGNIVLAGACYNLTDINITSCNETYTEGDFVVRNSTGEIVASIDSYGDLCISQGDCQASELQASCNPATGAYIMKNSVGENMSYIDFTGKLCLKGGLFEYSNEDRLYA